MSAPYQVQPVGINTDFIRDQPLNLSIETGFMGGGDVITYGDGTPFLTIQRDLLSARHRIHFIDARTDSKLFEMQKERFTYEYSAEHPDGSGNTLFEIQIDSAFMGGPTCYIQFPNVASGGSLVEFELKMHTFDKTNFIQWEGQPVAEFEKASLSTHSSLRIAPFVDPLPIIAMLMALTDKARKQKRGRGGIGGNSGFYTTNSGTAAWQGAMLGAAGGGA